MKATILQPNYIPWIGYFELIKHTDIFVFLDDVQFTKRDWRNRNYINLNNKKHLVSIPVVTKSKFYQKICQVQFKSNEFKKDHLEIFRHAYKKTVLFEEIYEFMSSLYMSYHGNFLSEFNINIIKAISKYFGINKKFINSSELQISSSSNQKLIDICLNIGADIYISGLSAMDYLDINMFKKKNISLKIANYRDQIKYSSNFIEKLSIIDLIFNHGKKAKNFLQDLDLIEYDQAKNIYLKNFQ